MTQPDAIRIEYEGEPVAKGRPRLGRAGIYTPSKTLQFEHNLAWVARSQIKQPLFGPILLEVSFRLPRPKETKFLYPPKPDLDNLIKYLDALNGIAWKDDSQIATIWGAKRYCLTSEKPGISIAIWPLGDFKASFAIGLKPQL